MANYILNYRFTFASERTHRSALPRFVVVAAVGVVLNAVTVSLLLATKWPLHYLAIQGVATCVVLAVGFLANRGWTF
jgi:putative flippase GtrA